MKRKHGTDAFLRLSIYVHVVWVKIYLLHILSVCHASVCVCKHQVDFCCDRLVRTRLHNGPFALLKVQRYNFLYSKFKWKREQKQNVLHVLKIRFAYGFSQPSQTRAYTSHILRVCYTLYRRIPEHCNVLYESASSRSSFKCKITLTHRSPQIVHYHGWRGIAPIRNVQHLYRILSRVSSWRCHLCTWELSTENCVRAHARPQ